MKNTESCCKTVYFKKVVLLMLFLFPFPIISVSAQNIIIENVNGFNGTVYSIVDGSELKGYYVFYKEEGSTKSPVTL